VSRVEVGFTALAEHRTFSTGNGLQTDDFDRRSSLSELVPSVHHQRDICANGVYSTFDGHFEINLQVTMTHDPFRAHDR
jgi:hypothetical protein